MKHFEATRPLGALLLLVFIFLTSSPVIQHYSFAQEDDTGHDTSADEGQQEHSGDEEYEGDYDEDQNEASTDYYYYGDDKSQPVEATPFDDFVILNEEEIITVNVLANDRAIFGANTTPDLVDIAQPSFGQVIANSDNTITYSPLQIPLPSGYEKVDSALYTATDGSSLYTGTINFRIQQVNDPPIAYSANYTISENQQSTFYLGAFDEDNDGLTYTVVSNITYGKSQLDQYSGRLLYAPLQDYSGKETLRFEVSDGLSTSDVATIVITVLEVGGESSSHIISEDDESDSLPDEPDSGELLISENTRPVADVGNDFYALAENLVSLDGDGSYDEDEDTMTFSWSQLTGPVVSLSANDTANTSFEAPSVELDIQLTFELTVTDGNLTDSATITVTIVPISIDILPNTYPNVINIGEPDVEVPVAIIGGAVLNVSSTVDVESLRFGPGSALATRYELSDFNEDGITDHTSYYMTGDLGLAPGDKTACLSGMVETQNGRAIEFNICKNVKVSE